MPVTFEEREDGKELEVHVTDKLTHEDYQRFAPRFEQALSRHKKIRVLFEMSRFHGWEARALWDDIKFDMRHFRDIERLAIVGEKKWQEWMAVFCRPFTTAEVRYFNHNDLNAARAWLAGKEEPRSS